MKQNDQSQSENDRRDLDGPQPLGSKDIDEQRQVEKQLVQMKRLYATLSQVNQTIVRVRTREELYQSICDVSTKFGEFPLVWVGLLDESTGDVKPVAASGLDVKAWPFQVGNIYKGDLKNSLAVAAILTSQLVISEDIQEDERVKSLQVQMQRYGYHSTAALPFGVNGKTIGVVVLVSAQVGLFQQREEINLLTEMGLDISFALETMETEKLRRQWADAFEHSGHGIAIGLPNSNQILTCNPAFARLQGYSIEEITSQPILSMYAPQDHEHVKQSIAEADRLGSVQYEAHMVRKDGTVYPVLMDVVSVRDENGSLLYRVATHQDMTERKKNEAMLQNNLRLLRLFVDRTPAAVAMLDRNMKYIAVSSRYRVDYRLGDQDIIGRSHYEVFPEIPERWREIHCRCLAGATEKAEEDPFPRLDGKLDWVRWEICPWYGDDNDIGGIILFSEVITERKRTEQSIQYQASLLGQVNDAIVASDENYIITAWNHAAERMYGWKADEVLGRKGVEVVQTQFEGIDPESMRKLIAETGRYVGEATQLRKDGTRIYVEAASIVLRDEANVITGYVSVNRDITERKRTEKQMQLQLQRMGTLAEIDRAISSSLDMRLSLDIMLSEILSPLNVDAASVLLLNDASMTLECVAAKGFRTLAIRQTRLRLGEGLAGQAGLERRMVHVKDLPSLGKQFKRAELLKQDEFLEYFAVPLVAKGTLKGVLEVFNRTLLDPDPEWMNYLETLGGQAAIAIDNAQLFEGMQKSNMELVAAYDATIAGWSHAMDLRDKETEGHTQRVTDLTVRLAERMGISAQEIVHIRRGALLHDIGKLGVPDHILLKPGPLTDEEWVIMRQHPVNAFQMLMTIPYLRPALDIPYGHHEKWDGTGYPRGLAGDQIPLAARLFSVVDVWDALRSDRPYRASWSAEKTREYIREQVGKYFDPSVVEVFLKMVDREV